MSVFAVNADPDVRESAITARAPIAIVDNFYADPDAVRDHALALSWAAKEPFYPGRQAEIVGDAPLLEAAIRQVRALATAHILPRWRTIRRDAPYDRITSIRTDFAIVDTPQDALSPPQRAPHIDDIPMFAICYLSDDAFGGTVFFERRYDVAYEADPTIALPPPSAGFPTGDTEQFRVIYRQAATFNRLVLYPGEIPHSADVSQPPAPSQPAFRSRLTQRFIISAD